MKNSEGQALLLILLAMATITTITLSIVSRSVSQIEVTSREEESLRAFSAAEAGIEEALTVGTIGTPLSKEITVPTVGTDTFEVSNYEADLQGFPANPKEYAYPFELYSGNSATIWLVSKDGSSYLACGTNPCFGASDIKLCWGENGTSATDPETPAIIATVVYETGGEYRVARRAFDPNDVRALNNGFGNDSGVLCTVDGRDFEFSANLDLADMGIPVGAGVAKFLTARLLYNTSQAHTLGVSSSGDFPPQGKKVSSVGQSGSATRKIEAYLINPSLPSIFDTAIYSGVGVTK